LSIKVRLASILLIVTLAVVAGYSMQAVHAEVEITLGSRQFNWASMNLGQMYLDGQGPYNLPYNTRVPGGKHVFRFIPPPGYFFVAWEVNGEFRPFENTPVHEYGPEAGLGHEGDPTIVAVYQRNGLPAYVGGVVLPTNTWAIFAPYLAMIGLVASAAVAAKKRRN